MKKKSTYKPLRPCQLISNITNQMMRVSGRRGRLSSGTFQPCGILVGKAARYQVGVLGKKKWVNERRLSSPFAEVRRYCVGSLFRFQHYVKWAKMNQVARFDTPKKQHFAVCQGATAAKTRQAKHNGSTMLPSSGSFFCKGPLLTLTLSAWIEQHITIEGTC